MARLSDAADEDRQPDPGGRTNRSAEVGDGSRSGPTGGSESEATDGPSGERCTGRIETSRGVHVWFSREAPYKRGDATAVNEDAWLALPLDEATTVLAVADGLGGQAHGERASALAIECLREALGGDAVDPANLREPLLDAIERCNAELLADGRGSGTTLAVVEIRDGTMRPYHVGDSSILVIGQRGRLKFRSISHSPIGYGIEAGLLEPDAALDHEERHWLSNLIGSAEMRIEIGAPLPLARFDTVVLCSDGLSDNLPLEAIAETMRSGPPEHAVRDLVRRCERAMAEPQGHPDDLTLLLYRSRF